MTPNNDAFPSPEWINLNNDDRNGDWGKISSSGGLSKREFFAGLALQGLVNNPETSNVNDIAETAVQYADALIVQLNKKKNL